MSTQEIEIRVPKLGESITEAMVGEWYVREGQYVAADKNLVSMESDKATFDIPAARGGIVSKILKKAGETAQVEEVIGYLKPAEAPAADLEETRRQRVEERRREDEERRRREEEERRDERDPGQRHIDLTLLLAELVENEQRQSRLDEVVVQRGEELAPEQRREAFGTE